MSETLQSIISSMINDAPPGNNITLIKDIKSILNNENSKKIIADNLKQFHLNKDFKLVKLTDDEFGIISKFNQFGLKFYDPSLNLKFDYDFESFKVIDVETDATNPSTTDEVVQLNKVLEAYAVEHYPTFYKSIVVQDNADPSIVYFIIVDENLNDANFYNGKWQSFYKLDTSTGDLTGELSVKIHYYEDGNVILNTGKKISQSNVTYRTIISTIETIENAFELAILNNFSNLNESLFKNLRRQLPINRSKVQWGKAIGNYKLGQDAAGGRH